MEGKDYDGEKHGSKNGEREENYEEIISRLPKEKGWNGAQKLHQYKGFWYYPLFLKGLISAQSNFQLHNSNDIILCSAPKTGTTWLKALAFAIVTRSSFDDSTSPILTKLPHECVPFLEFDFPNNHSNCKSFPLLATHAPYTILPSSITSSPCKIVYIYRDLKDVFISRWHFDLNISMSRNEVPISVEEAFDMFCRGVVLYGPYWDHVLGYWKAAKEMPGKIMLIKYEDMKRDTCPYVKDLAEFMGYPFSYEEIDKGVLNQIIKMCSFENLSNLEVNKNGKHRNDTSMAIRNDAYFRKAKVGDWITYLTPEMGKRLDSIVEEKFKGSGFTII